MYAYDPTPLNELVEATGTVEGGVIRHRITFNPAYDGDRMVLCLFLPPGEIEAPLQTVVYFPGAGVLSARPFDEAASPSSLAG